MRQTSANKIRLLGAFILALVSAPSFADVPPPSYVGAGAASSTYSSSPTISVTPNGSPQLDQNSFMKGMQAALDAQKADQSGAQTAAAAPEKKRDLGSVDDNESISHKASVLAKKAQKERDLAKNGNPRSDTTDEPAPPPEIEILQNVNETRGGATALATDDDLISKSISVDLRKEAQKEAALSYGARGGLAKRNYEIMESIQGFEPALDRVFNFRALLIKAPSGMLIEPPIVRESTDAVLISDGGNEAAVANAVYQINKRAKIVSAPRDWRQYLVQSWSDVPPPPRILWPKNAEEQRDWNRWVSEGWKAGIDQAEQIFESNVNRVSADYKGMVRYRVLLAQDMISAPYAMHEDRGVTGDDTQMRVGDSALRITGPSKFLTKAELWKPADR